MRTCAVYLRAIAALCIGAIITADTALAMGIPTMGHAFGPKRKKPPGSVSIEDGRIVGQGLYDDLIESNPIYWRLYRRQWANSV